MTRLNLISIDAPTQPLARFSLGRTGFVVVALNGDHAYPDAVLGTFMAAGKRYAVLGSDGESAEHGPDLVEMLTPRELEIACLIASGCDRRSLGVSGSAFIPSASTSDAHSKAWLAQANGLAARIAARFG